MAKQELLATIRDRYRRSSRNDKSRVLDEFISVTGHHRKHGIRLLAQSDDGEDKPTVVGGQRIYDEAVRGAVIVVWEAADGPFLRITVANHAAQGDGVARHHGQTAGLRVGRVSHPGVVRNARIGAGWSGSKMLKFR